MTDTTPNRRLVSWSDIPLDVAGLVLRCLPAHVDRVRFAAVCPQWCSAARQGPLPPPLPLLALQDGTVYSLPLSEPFRLPNCKGYTKACGGNWLFSGEDGRFLRDPLSNAKVTLPAMSRARIQFADDEARRLGSTDIIFDDQDLGMRMIKVRFCSSHLIAALVYTKRTNGIAICKPGASSWWSIHLHKQPLGIDPGQTFVDIAFHQGKLFALDCFQLSLFAIDISVDHGTDDPYISQVQRVINEGFSFQSMYTDGFSTVHSSYLVKSCGVLLMVHRVKYRVELASPDEDSVHAKGHNVFQVFQADFEQSKWNKLTTIGQDQLLFLGFGCSRSILMSQKDIPGDCIVFLAHDKALDGYDIENSCSCRIRSYNMKDGKISTILPTISWTGSSERPTWLFPHD